MADVPTCRTCYAANLTPDERTRFYAEPVVTSIYYCPEHQRVQDRLAAQVDWSKVIVRKPGEAAPEFPPFAAADDEDPR